MTWGDWAGLGGVLFLGAAALLAPYVAEVLKRRFLSAELRVRFEHKPPWCHRTKMQRRHEDGRVDEAPTYYFNFSVYNCGKSRAHSCEAIIEELWEADNTENYHRNERFWPINLKWETGEQFAEINPKRQLFAAIGHISHPQYQAKYEKSYSAVIEHSDTRLRFTLELYRGYFALPDSLFPGRHRLKVAIVGENFPRLEEWFELTWTGNWKDEEQDMLREAVLTLLQNCG